MQPFETCGFFNTKIKLAATIYRIYKLQCSGLFHVRIPDWGAGSPGGVPNLGGGEPIGWWFFGEVHAGGWVQVVFGGSPFSAPNRMPLPPKKSTPRASVGEHACEKDGLASCTKGMPFAVGVLRVARLCYNLLLTGLGTAAEKSTPVIARVCLLNHFPSWTLVTFWVMEARSSDARCEK